MKLKLSLLVLLIIIINSTCFAISSPYLIISGDSSLIEDESIQLEAWYGEERSGEFIGTNVTTDCNWTSSDNTIATVDENGMVQGLKKGNVSINAHYSGDTSLPDNYEGKNAEYGVSVIENSTWISFSKQKENSQNTKYITFKGTPTQYIYIYSQGLTQADLESIEFIIEDESIIYTVENSKVLSGDTLEIPIKPHKIGSTKVKASINNGDIILNTECIIQVVQAMKEIKIYTDNNEEVNQLYTVDDSFFDNGKDLMMSGDTSVQLKAIKTSYGDSIVTEDVTDKVQWTTSSTNVLTISQSGLMTSKYINRGVQIHADLLDEEDCLGAYFQVSVVVPFDIRGCISDNSIWSAAIKDKDPRIVIFTHGIPEDVLKNIEFSFSIDGIVSIKDVVINKSGNVWQTVDVCLDVLKSNCSGVYGTEFIAKLKYKNETYEQKLYINTFDSYDYIIIHEEPIGDNKEHLTAQYIDWRNYTPENIIDISDEVKWASLDEDIMTISDSGHVTFTNTGVPRVTASYNVNGTTITALWYLTNNIIGPEVEVEGNTFDLNDEKEKIKNNQPDSAFSRWFWPSNGLKLKEGSEAIAYLTLKNCPISKYNSEVRIVSSDEEEILYNTNNPENTETRRAFAELYANGTASLFVEDDSVLKIKSATILPDGKVKIVFKDLKEGITNIHFTLPICVPYNIAHDSWPNSNSGSIAIIVEKASNNNNSGSSSSSGGGGGGGGAPAPKMYTITTATNNGVITPSNPSIQSGKSQEFSFNANEGYEIKDVLLDGVSIGKLERYTLSKVKAAHKIELLTSKIISWSNCSDWAKTELEDAKSKGLIPETFDGLDFTKQITRKEFAAVAVKLYEAISKTEAVKPEVNPFSDTQDDYVLKAYALGITYGTSENEFTPDSNITREQMATMLTRALTKAEINTEIDLNSVNKFADDSEMNDWGMPSIYFMSNNGIIKGIGDNLFNPQGNAKIEEAIAISLRSVNTFSK